MNFMLERFARPASFLLSGLLAIYAALAGYLIAACDTPKLGLDEANLFVLFSVYVPFIPLVILLGMLWVSLVFAKRLRHVPIYRCLLGGVVLIVASGVSTGVITKVISAHEKCGGYSG